MYRRRLKSNCLQRKRLRGVLNYSVFEHSFLTMHAPLRVIFTPNSGYMARYAPFLWHKSPTNCDERLPGMKVSNKKNLDKIKVSHTFNQCGRWDLNPHGIAATRSLVLLVCQFRHFRIRCIHYNITEYGKSQLNFTKF